MAKKRETVPAKRLEHLYVAVDACAELGGQPYKVLDALHSLYSITGRRKLTVIDTEQGFHEKANGTTPEILSALGKMTSNFGRFVQDNPDWSAVVQTSTCRKFRQALEQRVFPAMVYPLIEVVEETSRHIRENAFSILQARDQKTLMGKRIHAPEDINLHVELFMPDGGGEGHYVFRNDVLSEAAEGARELWKQHLRKDACLDKGNRKKDEKGHMAAMVHAVQLTKAISHCLLSRFHPDIAAEMAPVPDVLSRNGTPSLATIRDTSSLYGQTPFPSSRQLGEMPEMIQAVRLTDLWPWSRKRFLNNPAKDLLDSVHRDTADASYLDLYANELPGMAPPKETLFILLTHDMPLREEFLRVSTGVEHSKERKKSNKKEEGARKKDTYRATNAYERLGLTKRAPEDYPIEAPFVGSEFVEFVYKEVLAGLAPYIPQRTRKDLKEIIRENSPTNDIDVSAALMKVIKEAGGIPFELRQSLMDVTEQVVSLELYVNRDIQAHGAAAKSGNYYSEKITRLAQAEKGQLEKS